MKNREEHIQLLSLINAIDFSMIETYAQDIDYEISEDVADEDYLEGLRGDLLDELLIVRDELNTIISKVRKLD